MSIANTGLPDDFIEKVLRHADASQRSLRAAVDEAILEVLHRPLTWEEKWAIIDKADTGASTAKLARAVFKRVTGSGEEAK